MGGSETCPYGFAAMEKPDMSSLTSPITEATGRPDTATLRIPSPWVWVARAVWVVLLSPLAVALVSSFGRYYEKLVKLESVGMFQEGWTSQTLRAAVTATGINPAAMALLVTVDDTVSTAIICAVGLFIFWRRSNEWIGLITSFALVGLGLANTPSNLVNMPEVLAVPAFVIGSLVWPTLFILPSIFPDGRFVPAWMRYYPIATYGLFVGGLILLDFSKTPPVPIVLAVFGLVALSTGSGVYRYLRRSNPLEKQQTKWFIFGMAVWLGTSIIAFVVRVVFPLSGPTLLIFELVNHVLGLSFVLIPLGLAFGLLRYKLWDVDFLINRAVVLGIMAVMFIVLAAGSLFALSQVAANLPGGPLVGVAVGAAIFGVAFNPVYKECRTFVDRLYGIKLDYAEAIKAYGGTKKEALKTGGTQTSFGSYSGLTLLGRGGMGEVYRAQHPTLNRAVAIKILPPHIAGKSDGGKRFMREAQTIATLKHPNIVSLHDVGEQDGKPYMVMEYIDGQDLSDLLHERGRLPLDEALPILRDVASALDYAHQNGVIHRDIKPSNVMIEKVTATSSGNATRAVLMDFGIAKSYAAGTKLTQTGMIGTLDYISPEQIQGASEVDARADVYSFGVMAYQVLTGQLPFIHNNPGAMVLAHLNQPAPDPRDLVKDLPDASASAVMRAMAKKPEQRFATAGEFISSIM